MTTSGTYTVANTQSDTIIREAYKRAGILSPYQIKDLITTAQTWINLILSSWANRGLNLWTVGYNVLNLNPNQNTYNLPTGIINIEEATIRTSNRNLGGTPFSSAGGVASNCFGGVGSCIQTSANGYISYQWGSQFLIQMVGIQSNITTTYSLIFETSNDGTNWTMVGNPLSQIYTAGQNVWFSIAVPQLGTYFRVRESGGATLNIQQLYFNNQLNDTLMTTMSRSQWVSFPQKNTASRPSQYVVQRNINPYVIVYPTPTSQFNAMFYTSKNAIQDIGQLTNNPQIPDRFMRALVAELSYELSLSIPNMQTINSASGTGIQIPPFDLNKTMELKANAAYEYKLASQEDVERDVPLRIYGDYLQGWTQI